VWAMEVAASGVIEVAAEALVHNLTKPGVEKRKQWRRRRMGCYMPWPESVDTHALGCRCSKGEEGVADRAGVGAGAEGGEEASSRGDRLSYLPCSDTSEEGRFTESLG
jgi:hypothetical protein